MDNIMNGLIGGADGPTSIFLAGVFNAQLLVITIVVGLVLCLFGLKLMRILAAIVGMLMGAGLGAVIVKLAELTGTTSLLVILGCGIVVALLALFLRRVGAFVSVLCYVFGALMTVLPAEQKIFILGAAVLALILAVVAAVYVEPLVVVISSLSGGLMVGPAMVKLVGMDDKSWIGYVIALALAAIGIVLQLLMQSGKIKKKDKIHSQKVKEEASRESEVEKARLILDDGEEYVDADLSDNINIDADDQDIEIIVDDEL